MDESSFSIKYNNAVTNDPCAICGERAEPQGPVALFLRDSWSLVCYECGFRYARRLQDCLNAYYTDLEAKRNPILGKPYLEILSKVYGYEASAYIERKEAGDREAIKREHELHEEDDE
jgi:hypothetical protein